MTNDEMNVTELMINDWIYPNTKVPTKIIDIHGNAEEVIGNNNGGIVDVCECYSVILTEEILKLNGFEHNISFNTNFYTYNNREIICIYDNGVRLNIFGKDLVINTVPEFQHLLKICGLIELADNFKIN